MVATEGRHATVGTMDEEVKPEVILCFAALDRRAEPFGEQCHNIMIENLLWQVFFAREKGEWRRYVN
ncbi:hypothetical protein [Escherichia coli]|uniref:hypothetical protein n=1 Tax=Escherichia coli TaxID=562 RepID=UPI0039A5226C